MSLCELSVTKRTRIVLIYLFTFFIGIYFMCYTLSLPFISRPIDHFCAPPFDFHSEHWSPKDWKVWAIPYWDQVPKHMKYPSLLYKTQSKCLQFNVVQKKYKNSSAKNLEIDYTEDSIAYCKNGWYYKDRKLSIISQFDLVCNKRWMLQILPLVSSTGFILSTIILCFESYVYVIIVSTTLMVATNLSVLWLYNIPLLFTMKFLSALFFGTNFYLIINLMTKSINKSDVKSVDVIFLAGLLGSVFGKGSTLLLIHWIQDWKIVHTLTTFSVIPIVILGIILFIIQTTDTERNITFVEDFPQDLEVEGFPQEMSLEINVETNNSMIGQRYQFVMLWITAFLYFCEDYAQHQKLERQHHLFDPKFICIQTLNMFMIFVSKRRISLKYTILLALISVCLSNACLTASGIFDYKYHGLLRTVLDYMNKIGVSMAFYANLFIFIEFIDKRNTVFNIILVNTIMFSYGLCPLALKLNEIDKWIIRTLLSSVSLVAIAVLIIQCFVADKTLNTIRPKAKNSSIFYSRNSLNDDKLYIVNEEM